MFNLIRKTRTLRVVFQFTSIASTTTSAASNQFGIWAPLPIQIQSNRDISSKSTPEEEKPLCPKPIHAEKTKFVAGILRDYGLSDAQVTKILSVKMLPRTIRTKMDFLHGTVGLSSTHLVKFVTASPWVLAMSLNNAMVPALDSLKGLLHTDENVLHAVMRSPVLLRHSTHKVVLRNIEFLKKQGAPDSIVSKILRLQPRTLTVPSSHLTKATDAVIKWAGIHPSKKMFMYALIVRLSMNDAKWNAKVAVYQRFGWSDQEILHAFKKWPYVFGSSSEKIHRHLDFCMNKLKLSSSFLLTCPMFLTLSLEKKIIPRCTVLEFLMSKGVKKRDKHTLKQVLLTELSFCKRNVSKYQELYPQVLDAYKGNMEFIGFDAGMMGNIQVR